MTITRLYPEDSIRDDQLSQLEEIVSSVQAPIIVLFMQEGGEFGSYLRNDFPKKAVRKLIDLSSEGNGFVLPVLDGTSRYTQQSVSDSKKEAIERRMTSSPA